MTPKELAEEIVLASRQDRYAQATVFGAHVESLLTAALNEAIENERDVALPHRKMELIGAASAAYEYAAKIAEQGPPPGAIVRVDGDVRDPGVVVTGFQQWIAKQIRAKAAKL